jgi:hypothetical protein
LNNVINLINEKVNILINYKFDSKMLMQRGVADYIEILCCEKINQLSTSDLIVNEAVSVRSIEDIEIKLNNNLYKIDIKTHDVNRDFSMPNLISIDRARKYLSIVTNHIIYIFIDYKIEDDIVTIINVLVKPIESLDWSYLAIQNLGKGQLQIKSMSDGLFFNDNVSRKEWLDKLIKEGKDYYERLILKVSEYKNNWVDETKWQ